MGIYTAYDSPAIDAVIETHMQTLTSVCLDALGADLESLVLGGSFGRGEGSVLLHSDGRVEPLRDYDIRLVLRKPVRSDVIESIRCKFLRATGLGGPSERFSGEHGFSLSLETMTVAQFASSFVRSRDISVYDHLHASHLIYGVDHAPALRFPAGDIPRVSGLRFLHQKMVGLVGHYPGPHIEGDVRRTLLYECHKAFVEIGTALTLLAGAYMPSYRARAELFAQRWRGWFPELAQELPDLADRLGEATLEKLLPGTAPPPQLLESFHNARAALMSVHRFYVHRLYGVEVAPDIEGCAHLRRALSRDLFRAVVTGWLRQYRIDGAFTQWMLNLAYHRLQRLKFAQCAKLHSFRALWECVRLAEGPLLDIYLAAWCALAAADHAPDMACLSAASAAISRLPGIKANRAKIGWERYRAVRESIVQAYGIWAYAVEARVKEAP